MYATQCELARKISSCYVKYYDCVVHHLSSIIYDVEVCKEIAQECFLRIFSKSIVLDPDSPNTRNFIISVARNIAIDYVRKKRMENARLKEKYYLEFSPNINRKSNQPIEKTVLGTEINKIVKSSVRQFNALKRYIFKEIVIRGKGVAYVSNKSSISRYRVKKYCDEVVDKLKEDLAEYR